MPEYLEFIFTFGAQSGPRDLRFSGFREQITRASPATAMPWLSRSGNQLQLCYNLKGVTLKTTNPSNTKIDEWSIRQAAVHHQFDLSKGTTVWITTKGNKDLQQRYKELTGTEGRPEDRDFTTTESSLRASLATHLMYARWATDGWRWYLRWLEAVIEQNSADAVIVPRGEGRGQQHYSPYDIQDLQYWEDKVHETVMVLEANHDVLGSLRRFYADLQAAGELKNCQNHVHWFDTRLNNVMDDFRMQISRARLLATIIKNRKSLISQHFQGQSAERSERLAQSMEREAIVMRIVTIVTLIYLPATFVSTSSSTKIRTMANLDTAHSRITLSKDGCK
ncbi:MAG: hypothetical protein M1822_002361 [Bathelium mastoideum]|nr:MAG: hypothetical protein M1822_002361 [Bathelium mastoideum]